MSAVSSAQRAAPLRWRPRPLLVVSALLHAAALALLLWRPDTWPWLLGLLIANHALIGAAVMAPKSAWLGDTIITLPGAATARREIALTFDDGPHPDITPAVLDILDLHAAKATFFCIAEHVRQYPDVVRAIVERGHSVENHSLGHPTAFAFYGPRRLAREIDSAQAQIAAITGAQPGFFRAPFGFRGPFLDPVLSSRALRCVTWTRRGLDTVSENEDAILRRLTRDLAPGDVLLLHDSHRKVLSVLPRLLAEIARRDLRPVTLSSAFRDALPASR